MATREFWRLVRENQSARLTWAYVGDHGAVSFQVGTQLPCDGPPPDAYHDGRDVILGRLGLHRRMPGPPDRGLPCPLVSFCELTALPPRAAREVLAAWALGEYSDDAVWHALAGLYTAEWGGVS
jgi:hypothetical protein